MLMKGIKQFKRYKIIIYEALFATRAAQHKINTTENKCGIRSMCKQIKAYCTVRLYESTLYNICDGIYTVL